MLYQHRKKQKPLKVLTMQKQQQQQEEENFDIYDQQIRTGKEIIYSNFNSSITGDQKRWTMLVAQMQSGKTGTYLFTAFEMLTQNLVSNVVIFSGNREIELREQTEKGLEDFVFKYSLYLGQVMDWDERERVRKSRDALSKIRVVWGSDLKKVVKKDPRFPRKKTLFIFDESHYAQNKGMQVDKFLTEIGISATGEEGLEEADNYVLSVSATPMSELSDTIHHSQRKGMVYLEPGPTYYGVAEMCENGNIVGFESEDWHETLITALRRAAADDAHKYGLIRMTAAPSTSGKKGLAKGMAEEEEEDVESIRLAIGIATSAGWTCRFCDSDLDRDPLTKINICDLEQEPTEGNILVFLKGKCRMGQVVPKRHIAFGMETSKHPNTDVILQSLLGRFCGHHSSKNIMVYLPETILSSGELEKYVDLCSGLSERRTIARILTKAKNIIPGKKSDTDAHDAIQEPKLHEIIPLKFPRLALSKDGQTLLDNKVIKRKILDHFHGKHLQTVENLNTQEQYQDIHNTIVEKRRLDEDGSIIQDFSLRVASVNKTHKTYECLPEVYRHAFDTQFVPSLPQACAPDADGEKARLFVFGELDNYYGFQKGDVFLDIRISSANHLIQLKKLIPKTTGREIFSHKLETGETILTNGGMLLGLKPETHCNVELMKQGLSELIQLSLQPRPDTCGVIYSRRINSVINESGESIGITMTQEIYDAVKPGGRVFCEIREEFGVDLVLKKGRGNLGDYRLGKKSDLYFGLIKFAEISW